MGYLEDLENAYDDGEITEVQYFAAVTQLWSCPGCARSPHEGWRGHAPGCAVYRGARIDYREEVR